MSPKNLSQNFEMQLKLMALFIKKTNAKKTPQKHDVFLWVRI